MEREKNGVCPKFPAPVLRILLGESTISNGAMYFKSVYVVVNITIA